MIGGERNEIAYAGVETTDGGFIVVGSTNSKNSFDVKDSRGYDNTGGNDFWVAKLSSVGVLEWSKTFGGTLDDIATSVSKTSNGEYVVLGTSQSTDGDSQFNGTNGGLLMVRLKQTGEVVSKRLFAGGNTSSGATYQAANSFSKPTIKVLANGRMVVTASRSVGVSPFSRFDFYLAILTPTGDTLWERNYGGGFEDYVNDVIPTSDGGFLMVGGTLSLERDIAGAGQGFLDFLVIKTDLNGNQLWKKGFGGLNYDVAFSALESSDKSGFLIVGESSSSSPALGNTLGEKDGIILKLDNKGNLLSRSRFGGTENDGFFHVNRGADGKIYLVGTSQSDIGDVTTRGTLTDLWLMVFNESTFKPDYHKLLGGADIDLARNVVVTSKGGLYITGTSRSSDTDVSLNRGQNDFWILNMTLPPPILFSKFEAFLNDQQEIELVWVTSYENNSQFILIEKSSDNKTFSLKDEIFAAGNSEVLKTYGFVDKNPVYGKNYYRIRYSDVSNKYYNGPTVTFTYSPLSMSPVESLSVIYPNPVVDYLNFSTEIIEPKISVFSSSGKRIQADVRFINPNDIKILFNNVLNPGIYFVEIAGTDSIEVKKFIVK